MGKTRLGVTMDAHRRSIFARVAAPNSVMKTALQRPFAEPAWLGSKKAIPGGIRSKCHHYGTKRLN